MPIVIQSVSMEN